jgi:hypothetical protein
MYTHKIFLVYKEVQMGSVAKSYMRKEFLIYKVSEKTFYFDFLSHNEKVHKYDTATIKYILIRLTTSSVLPLLQFLFANPLLG